MLEYMTSKLKINVYEKHKASRMSRKDSNCELNLRSQKKSFNTELVVALEAYH